MKIEIILDGYPNVDFLIPIKIDGRKVARVSAITRSGMKTTLEAHVSKNKICTEQSAEKK